MVFIHQIVESEQHISFGCLFALHYRTGEFLFGWSWHGENVKAFAEAVKASGTNPESLLDICLLCWDQFSYPDAVAALHFGTIIHTLSLQAGEEDWLKLILLLLVL